jgi:hypothetical protein
MADVIDLAAERERRVAELLEPLTRQLRVAVDTAPDLTTALVNIRAVMERDFLDAWVRELDAEFCHETPPRT